MIKQIFETMQECIDIDKVYILDETNFVFRKEMAQALMDGGKHFEMKTLTRLQVTELYQTEVQAEQEQVVALQKQAQAEKQLAEQKQAEAEKKQLTDALALSQALAEVQALKKQLEEHSKAVKATEVKEHVNPVIKQSTQPAKPESKASETKPVAE